MERSGPVCVIIAAHNSEATIRDAVQTSLMQGPVGQVIVVDDASSDGTAAAARAAAQGDARLTVLRQVQNKGPAESRNLAIAATNLPFVAVLDADDYLLPGRFDRLLGISGCDMVADNIQFVSDTQPGLIAPDAVPAADPGVVPLDLPTFVRGNLGRKSVTRGELGFLKPMISRAFLLKHGLLYDPALWLGEDFDLYVRLLAKGARFGVSRQIGYIARVRPNSLSGRHRTSDLYALLRASEEGLGAAAAQGAGRAVFSQYLRMLRGRYLLRKFLDLKAQHGMGTAARFAMAPPSNLIPIARGVVSDKVRARLRHADPSPIGSSLLPTAAGMPIA